MSKLIKLFMVLITLLCISCLFLIAFSCSNKRSVVEEKVVGVENLKSNYSFEGNSKSKLLEQKKDSSIFLNKKTKVMAKSINSDKPSFVFKKGKDSLVFQNANITILDDYERLNTGTNTNKSLIGEASMAGKGEKAELREDKKNNRNQERSRSGISGFNVFLIIGAAGVGYIVTRSISKTKIPWLH